MASKFLTAEWRKLAIVNYAVDPAILKPYLPYKTELDLWNDTCYVSLVGFRFLNTRLKGFRIPLHINFEEVNLRFYVRYKSANGWKRGVTFIREIVPKPALTFIANVIYKEKYMTLPMRHSWVMDDDEVYISYEWKYKNAWNNFSIKADNAPVDIPPDSEEEFITEHYWGYARVSNNLTTEYEVQHPRWQTYPVRESAVNVDFGKLYGSGIDFLQNQNPVSVMLAEGSEIAVLQMSEIR